MTSLFLSPHHDDETLFAAYTLLRHRPIVLVCFEPVKQQEFGVSLERREREFARAMGRLRIGTWRTQRGWPDTDLPTSRQILEAAALLAEYVEVDRVFAPAMHENGHEQHNAVAELAMAAFPHVPITWYETYRRGEGRTRGSMEVEPSLGMVGSKLAAMASYQSQVEIENTRPWFDDWQREWIA